MDDDLFFAIQGITAAATVGHPSRGGPASTRLNVKAVEESCRQLCSGYRQNAAWRRALAANPKQRKAVMQGVVAALESNSPSRTLILSALSVLRLFVTEKTSVFNEESADDAVLVKRLVVACARFLEIVPDEITNFTDELLESTAIPLRIWDVSALNLRFFSSHSVFPTTSSAGRLEISRRSELLRLVCEYMRYQLELTETPTAFMKLVALNLVEQLSFSSPVTATVFARDVGALLVGQLGIEALRETTLKAMLNLSNHCPEAAGALVSSGNAVVTVVQALRTSLNKPKLYELESKDFDCALLCLGVLGNLVEYPETGASVVIASSEEYIGFLCEVYASSLPVAARQSLADSVNGPSKRLVEFDWSAEALVMSAHVCLVLGCVVRDSRTAGEWVLKHIPGGKQDGYSTLIQVLQQFLAFQSDAGVLTADAEGSVNKVLGYFLDANSRSMLPPTSLLPPARTAGPRSTSSSSSTTSASVMKKPRLPSRDSE